MAAAVAGQLADPDRRVVALTTAAGFEAGARAWALAVERGLPIIVVILAGGGEETFSRQFAAAFLAHRPAVVTA